MYLSIKQHDQFRTLLMSFEVPFRSYAAETTLTTYDDFTKLRSALLSKRSTISPADPMLLRTVLPKMQYQDLYDRLAAAKNSIGTPIVAVEQDVPMVGALNIVTFSFTNLFRDLYLLFGGYSSYCVLAEKYRYARNKLEHPGCKTLQDTDLIPVLSFVKDITEFLNSKYFFQKERSIILQEIAILQNRRIDIPIPKHNFYDMPYDNSKIVCRQTEIDRLKAFLCGNPGDLRKRHSCCVFGYGGVGKTALVLEAIKQIVQDLWDERVLNDYHPQYVYFFSGKRQRLDLSVANGKIIEKPLHRFFENTDELVQHIFASLGVSGLRNFHEEGIIVVDNLEALSTQERDKLKYFIEAQTPPEMQFLITSRNSEDYEVNYKLSGFEDDSGVKFVREYVEENALDIDLKTTEIDELLALSKGNTLVLALCLRRLSQQLSSLSGLQAEFSSFNAWKNLRASLKHYPGNAYEVISEFMFKDTFEEIETVFAGDSSLFYKILKIFAVYQDDGVDVNTICLLAKEPYPKVDSVVDTLCNYLILERSSEQYSLNKFAEKYIINRFMPDATTFSKMSNEIQQREAQVKQALEKLNFDIERRPELAKIMNDWYIISDSDKITAARMYNLYGEAHRECRKDSSLKARWALEEVIKTSEEAESLTAHPYVKYQKARILQLIDRSNLLDEKHSQEIVNGFRTAIFVIKTVDQFSAIQRTKSYASLLWLFGQYLSDIGQTEEAIHYLESGRGAFELLKIEDKEYYQCLSKLGMLYLNYFKLDRIHRSRYLEMSQSISQRLQENRENLGDTKRYADKLKNQLQAIN